VNVRLYLSRNCLHFLYRKKLICLFPKDYYWRFLQDCKLSLVSHPSHNFIRSPLCYYLLWHIIILGVGVDYSGKIFACHKNNLISSRFKTEELISSLFKHRKLYSKLISIRCTISSVIVFLTEGFVAHCTVYSFRCVLCT